MKWATFYDNFYDYDEKKMINCIQLLENIGPVEEIIDVINFSGHENGNKVLVERAFKKGVKFSADELEELENNFDTDFFEKIIVPLNMNNSQPLKPADILVHAEWLDEKTLAKMAYNCSIPFSEKELDDLGCYLDYKIMKKLYEKNGIHNDLTDEFVSYTPIEDDEIEIEKMSLLEKAFVFRTINKLSKMLKL